MKIEQFFKSVLEQEQSSVVICDLNHTIVYMNPFAIKRYHKDLTGSNLLKCHNSSSNEKIIRVVEWFKTDKNHNIIYESHNEVENKDVYMVAMRDDNGNLIGYFEKHEYRNRETKTFYEGLE